MLLKIRTSRFLLGILLTVCNGMSATELDETFFPGLHSRSEGQIRWYGLAALYPGKVLFEAPLSSPVSVRSEAARIEDLPRGIKYVRIYRLDEAITAIRAHAPNPALILDFRYLISDGTGSELAALLHGETELPHLTSTGNIPEEVSSELEALKRTAPKRDYPAIVLCNRKTAGPFEALLHTLQAEGSIIAIGENTAGQTGFYRRIPPDIWVIEGELRPDPQISLVGQGFKPRIEIPMTAEANYESYHLYEAGTELVRLLRDDRNMPDRSTTKNGDTAHEEHEPNEIDRVLQRAVDIVTALQVLRQLPSS